MTKMILQCRNIQMTKMILQYFLIESRIRSYDHTVNPTESWSLRHRIMKKLRLHTLLYFVKSHRNWGSLRLKLRNSSRLNAKVTQTVIHKPSKKTHLEFIFIRTFLMSTRYLALFLFLPWILLDLLLLIHALNPLAASCQQNSFSLVE